MPEGKNEKAVQKLTATLIEKGLVREVRAKPGMPLLRRDEEGRALALIITKSGRAVINMRPEDRSGDGGPDTDVLARRAGEPSLSRVVTCLSRANWKGHENPV